MIGSWPYSIYVISMVGFMTAQCTCNDIRQGMTVYCIFEDLR